MTGKRHVYLEAFHRWVEVDRKTYRAINAMEKREERLLEKERKHGCISLEALDENYEWIPDADCLTLERKAEVDFSSEVVQKAIAQLSTREQYIIHSIYFDGKSERQVAHELHIARMTLNYQHKKTLEKLGKVLKL